MKLFGREPAPIMTRSDTARTLILSCTRQKGQHGHGTNCTHPTTLSIWLVFANAIPMEGSGQMITSLQKDFQVEAMNTNIKVCGHYGVVQRKQCASLMLKDVCILLKLAELDSSGISMIIKVHRFKLCGLIYRLSITRQPNDLATRPKNPLHCCGELREQ